MSNKKVSHSHAITKTQQKYTFFLSLFKFYSPNNFKYLLDGSVRWNENSSVFCSMLLKKNKLFANGQSNKIFSLSLLLFVFDRLVLHQNRTHFSHLFILFETHQSIHNRRMVLCAVLLHTPFSVYLLFSILFSFCFVFIVFRSVFAFKRKKIA